MATANRTEIALQPHTWPFDPQPHINLNITKVLKPKTIPKMCLVMHQTPWMIKIESRGAYMHQWLRSDLESRGGF